MKPIEATVDKTSSKGFGFVHINGVRHYIKWENISGIEHRGYFRPQIRILIFAIRQTNRSPEIISAAKIKQVAKVEVLNQSHGYVSFKGKDYYIRPKSFEDNVFKNLAVGQMIEVISTRYTAHGLTILRAKTLRE